MLLSLTKIILEDIYANWNTGILNRNETEYKLLILLQLVAKTKIMF